MSIPTESFEAFSADFQLALDWLESIGVRCSNGRLRIYGPTLDRYIDLRNDGLTEEALGALPEVVEALSELVSFVDIYRAFWEVPPDDLHGISKKLQKGVNGPIHSRNEDNKNNLARNILFEARAAAMFHRPSKNLITLLNPPTETGAHFQDKNILVECKRITSKRKLESNVRTATNQLGKAIDRADDNITCGVVAVDITKFIVSPGQLYVATDDDDIINSCRKLKDEFNRKHRHTLDKIYREKGQLILGTLICMSYMAVSKETNKFVIVKESDFLAGPDLPDVGKQFARELTQAMG